MAECPNQEKNRRSCACTYTACSKMGICCECIASHRARGELPGCLFPPDAERTYDRSIRHYVTVMQGRL